MSNPWPLLSVLVGMTVLGALFGADGEPAEAWPALPTGARLDGYHGYWYGLGSAYSGGLGTYSPHHIPMAVYAKQADKTFFVWGGASPESRRMLMMISCYDHKTGLLPRPVVVRDCVTAAGKAFTDAHANPTLTLDAAGRLWVFCAARGSFPGQVYRGREPYDISAFELVLTDSIPYPQPWHVEGEGFMLVFTKYTGGREAYWRTSPDGRTWSQDRMLARGGHYQATCCYKGRVLDALDFHPGSSDNRTNLYFVQTADFGKTWQTVEGKPIEPPLPFPENAALVRDYRKENRFVFLNDITTDADGRPVIFYITSASGAYGKGPQGNPRIWTVAHWTGKTWTFSEVTTVDHNYDLGSIYVEPDGAWRIIGPSAPGPQKDSTGGEMAAWLSADQGASWTKAADLTAHSPRNHSFARRPVSAHPDFYAFWADGEADKRSESFLYFATKDGKVFRMPPAMSQESARPEPVEVLGSSPTAR